MSEFKLISAWPLKQLKRIISRSNKMSFPAPYNVYLLLDLDIILLGDHAELSLNSDYSYQYIRQNFFFVSFFLNCQIKGMQFKKTTIAKKKMIKIGQ